MKNVRYDFSGMTVVITGGARGLGLAHALGFAEAGADIVVTDIDSKIESLPYDVATTEDLEAAREQIEAHGVRCRSAVCDVRDEDQVKAMIDGAIAEFGRIDVLVNNAGICGIAPLTEMTAEEWDETLNVNLRGMFLCSKFAAAQMIEQGSGKIINTASTSSIISLPRNAHYTASKHGVIGFTKGAALDLAPHRITVNAVSPGGIDTPMISGMMASPHAEWLSTMEELSGPFNLIGEGGRMGPEEITNAILWLASDAANFVTGTSILVDAGLTVK